MNNKLCLKNKPNWNACDEVSLALYEQIVDNTLQTVMLPKFINNKVCVADIDRFYNDIIESVQSVVMDTIPQCSKGATNEYNIPGWHDYAQDKHDIARDAFKEWFICGKPRQGAIFENMKRTRAVFKLAFRYCKSHIEQSKADACAKNINNQDPRKFWNSVYKISNNRCTNHVVSVGGVTGDEDIAAMWKDHFKKLYNSVEDCNFKTKFEQKLLLSPDKIDQVQLTTQDVFNSINGQKLGKAAGPDGLTIEAFKYGGRRLHLLLSIFFNLCISIGHLPPAFCEATIIPLVKSKVGDLGDCNNYRAIAVSTAVSKILENILLRIIDSHDDIDDFQFGFKKHHSTLSCTALFKKTVDYYTKRGSHVFTCFIDFNKAFDRVNYWQLFCKLLDHDDTSKKIVSLLAFWYSNQSMHVRWQNATSDEFSIGNGVRQGGILSPFLFRFYIQHLIATVTQSRIGCNLGGYFVNLLAYADDMVLLAPSWAALQSLLNIVHEEASLINMTFNTLKTVCMIFNPKEKCKIICDNFPRFQLAGCNLDFVTKFKYLGHIIDHDMCDDDDINREIKCLYTRTNILIRRFHRCSVGVKLKLFKSYCLCFYDIALWRNFTAKTLNHFLSCYHKCIKMFFGFHKYYSVTNMLFELRLPSFDTLLLNCKIMLGNQLERCGSSNKHLHAIISIITFS
ncbi:MAG: reverse transcriptase family protein [Oscillospiraceae bacterium]